MGFIIVSIMLFVWLFSVLRSKNKSKEQQAKNKDSRSDEANNNLSVSLKITSRLAATDVQIYQKSIGILPSIPVELWNGYVSPSGGYVNYANYLIGGIDAKTGRKRSREIEDVSAASALAQAEEFDIVSAYLIEVLPNRKPTERQLALAKDIGATIPDGACFHDVSSIISRIYDDDEDAVDLSLARCAALHGFTISRYTGKKTIMKILDDCSQQEQKQFRADLQAIKAGTLGEVSNDSYKVFKHDAHSIATAKMNPITRSIPNDPRFYNIGQQVFHKSRECFEFDEHDDWDAVTEQAATQLGMTQCPYCKNLIVFSYGNTKVYHTTRWCSSAKSICHQSFEDDAIAKGMTKCKTCQNRDAEGIYTYHGHLRHLDAFREHCSMS